MLDSRKDHIKYWRPQIILFVSNPKYNVQLIDFVNDIKKSGLYVLGHVCVGSIDDQTDPAMEQQSSWLDIIDYLKVKAFVELTVASSVREGMHHLIRISGLGGMKPNTVCLGFFGGKGNSFENLQESIDPNQNTSVLENSEINMSPVLEALPMVQSKLSHVEYVNMMRDVLRLNRNLLIGRHFHKFDKAAMLGSSGAYIDVWPVDFLGPDTSHFFDNTCLFMLQIACVLKMVPGWKKRCRLRVFLCHEHDESSGKEQKLKNLLYQLRIKAQVHVLKWNHVTQLLPEDFRTKDDFGDDYLEAVNNLIRSESKHTATSFLYLPQPPDSALKAKTYIERLNTISVNLHPVIFVHGLFPVTSTTL